MGWEFLLGGDICPRSSGVGDFSFISKSCGNDTQYVGNDDEVCFSMCDIEGMINDGKYPIFSIMIF